MKYRGTAQRNERIYLLIGADGFSVLPVSSLGLGHQVHDERISTGIPDLDKMLSAAGFYRGSSILVSGVAGSGKSSISAAFAAAACARGEKALHFSFEESAQQTVRNMRSIGLRLQPYIDAGLLECVAARPTFYGLELHLAVMLRQIEKSKPTSSCSIRSRPSSFSAISSRSNRCCADHRLSEEPGHHRRLHAPLPCPGETSTEEGLSS